MKFFKNKILSSLVALLFISTTLFVSAQSPGGGGSGTPTEQSPLRMLNVDTAVGKVANMNLGTAIYPFGIIYADSLSVSGIQLSGDLDMTTSKVFSSTQDLELGADCDSAGTTGNVCVGGTLFTVDNASQFDGVATHSANVDLGGSDILNVDQISGNSLPLKLTGTGVTNYLTIDHDDTNAILDTSTGFIQANSSLLVGAIQGTEATEATFFPLYDLPCGVGTAGDECSFSLKNDSNTNVKFYSEYNGTDGIKNQALLVLARLRQTQGSDVASATNLVLPQDGNTFELTGTTKVDLISNIGWNDGDEITLICNESVTIDDGTATSTTNITLVLAGGGDFGCTADDVLVLKLSETTAGGQAWRELSRSAN